MKLAEKLRLMSATMTTPEELVTEEIVGFFDDSFRSNEMIGNLERLISSEDLLNRRHECILSFQTKDDEKEKVFRVVRHERVARWKLYHRLQRIQRQRSCFDQNSKMVASTPL